MKENVKVNDIRVLMHVSFKQIELESAGWSGFEAIVKIFKPRLYSSMR